MEKNKKDKRATFSGGCFWCTEYDFEQREGVVEVINGYAGGKEKNPTYEQVSSGKTGYREAVQIIYNPKKINYNLLLDLFWKSIDPTDDSGQFVDRGFQYTTAIFYEDDKQKKLAEKSKNKLEKSKRYNKPIVTQIIPFTNFYSAEEYHQNYSKKNPLKYKLYRKTSGRDEYIKNNLNHQIVFEQNKKYKKLSDEELKKRLTNLQYYITQKEGTEKAFINEYWNNKEEGIYVDIVSGEPLFSSLDKYNSGTGWPSFTKPLVKKNIITKRDYKLLFPRIEIKSKNANSHLGHLFNDSQKNKTGKRYCINSAALRFISKDKLKEERYGEFLKLFK